MKMFKSLMQYLELNLPKFARELTDSNNNLAGRRTLQVAAFPESWKAYFRERSTR